MHYKIWSKEPSHIWDYVVFNQMAEGNFIKYEMKDELEVDYIIYESHNPIEESTFENRGLYHAQLSDEELNKYIK